MPKSITSVGRSGRITGVRSLGLVLAIVATGLASQSASGASSRPHVRLWHGMLIEPLDASPAPTTTPAPTTIPAPLTTPAPIPSAPTPASPANHGRPPIPLTLATDDVLSNETTVTRWAYATRPEPIYARPRPSSTPVAAVHLYTEDGFPEVYLLLARHLDAQGRAWIEVRIPMRPNGRVGWVQRSALGAFRLTNDLLVVDRRRLRMSLYVDGKRAWSAPVAVGKPSTPTPAGHFWIRERFKLEDPRSGYYPYALGTADYSTLTDWPGGGVVGIHGPYFQPGEIPGRISHGCIRLRVADDAWLGQHVGVGTPLRVQ
ncbi:MAG: L,D-transpeptidase [Solirubrobacteraceae bacterium]